MRPDDAVDVARLDTGDDLAGLGWCEEPAQRLDADGVAGEAVGERVAVLARQQRRGDEHGDLLAVLDRLEGSPHRDLGLAEADVAAQQAIHRIRPLHVRLDVDGGDALVGCVDEREGVFHLPLPRRVLAERKPLRVDALLVEDDELLRDLPHGRADPALGLGEVAAAEAVQRRRLAADVLTQHVDLVGGDVQPVIALVGHEEVVPLDAAHRALDHALVTADAVLGVDDVHAGLEVLEDAEGLTAPARPAMGATAAGEVALRDDRQLGGRERDAVVERSDDDPPADVQSLVEQEGGEARR